MTMNDYVDFDEYPDELDDDEPNTPFRVTDDSGAQWVLRKLRREENEIARLNAIATAERDRINEWQTREARPHADNVARWTALLVDYRKYLDELDPKTPAHYTLPDGTLKRTKGRQSVEVLDEGEFIAHAESHDMADLVHVKKSVDKAALKKLRAVDQGNGVAVIAGVDGFPLPGVVLVTPEDSYTVTLTKDNPL